MTKKPFHSMSEDFDELEIEPVRMREPDIPDDWLEAETGEASKPEPIMIELDEFTGAWPLCEKLGLRICGIGEGRFIEAIELEVILQNLPTDVEKANKQLLENCALYNLASQYSFDQLEKLKVEALKLAEALEELCNDQDVPFGIREFAHSALTNWRRYLNGSDNE